MNSEKFIEKIKQLPNRVRKNKICYIGKKMLVKTGDINDYLTLTYKDMPENLRIARKRGMKASFPSFKILEQLDQIFMSQSFINKLGLALVSLKDLDIIIKQIALTIKEDEIKIQAILEN